MRVKRSVQPSFRASQSSYRVDVSLPTLPWLSPPAPLSLLGTVLSSTHSLDVPRIEASFEAFTRVSRIPSFAPFHTRDQRYLNRLLLTISFWLKNN